jgi:hypothetical protein
MIILEGVKEAKEIKKKIKELEDKYESIVDECVDTTESDTFYEFNYKEFPRDIKIPLDTLERCEFQVSVNGRSIEEDDVLNMEFKIDAWEPIGGQRFEELHQFVVKYDELIKYFKEIKKDNQ